METMQKTAEGSEGSEEGRRIKLISQFWIDMKIFKNEE